MSKLSKRERVDRVLNGQPVDRIPVSAWRHFIPQEQNITALANASLKHFKDFDWDWLKVNPRATYYAEAWGNHYDYQQYNHVYPRLVDGPLRASLNLEKIGRVDPTGGVFAEQLELMREIKNGIGEAHFLQTVFSPLSVLAFLVGWPTSHKADVLLDAQLAGLQKVIRDDPQGVHEVLATIANTLGQYASALVDSGASGLFFAITRLARNAALNREDFVEFGKPYDLQVLNAVQGAHFNLLHICGPEVYFDQVLDYPVHAINWASLGQRNPGLLEASHLTDKVLVGGINETDTLLNGNPESVTREALDAIQIMTDGKFLLTPGCAVRPNSPEVNLHAMRRATDLASQHK